MDTEGSGPNSAVPAGSKTVAGSTGAQTITTATGSVLFAPGASSLVVTNASVTVNSIIVATVGTNDISMTSVQAIAGAGSFTLMPNTPPAAQTRVCFIVVI